MNERESEIVYVISVATVNNKTIRCKPVFQSRSLAEQYVEENEEVEGDIERVTYYYEYSDF
ncbi:hypothetical protein EXE51_05310 [Halorubrum sp. CGM5_25_10-8B]|uniref:hypothetical protein n=1 Tax=Halorubrum sp. CGM5_25_10-8B TaxID=2518115 RepID=UPI0010F56C66|nr:hypothetical protein [Halorubrum sp. CGM5_25_10-8B]TKX38009.1 hypothetical protein EXE51_05310 [Halorubrum sp. CGM5_25_10-8B]